MYEISILYFRKSFDHETEDLLNEQSKDKCTVEQFVLKKLGPISQTASDEEKKNYMDQKCREIERYSSESISEVDKNGIMKETSDKFKTYHSRVLEELKEINSKLDILPTTGSQN